MPHNNRLQFDAVSAVRLHDGRTSLIMQTAIAYSVPEAGLDENRDMGVPVATLKKDMLSKSVYSVPLISTLIALPYILLCVLNNFAFSVPYIIGIFWFLFICPFVVLVWLAKTLHLRIRTGGFSYPIIKGIVLLVPAYIIFGVGLFTFGCAVSA